MKKSREESSKEIISRDSGISSLASQCSTPPEKRSSFSSISSSTPQTPRSRSSTGSEKNVSSLTVSVLNSSACVTPENTPNKFSTPSVIVNVSSVHYQHFGVLVKLYLEIVIYCIVFMYSRKKEVLIEMFSSWYIIKNNSHAYFSKVDLL